MWYSPTVQPLKTFKELWVLAVGMSFEQNSRWQRNDSASMKLLVIKTNLLVMKVRIMVTSGWAWEWVEVQVEAGKVPVRTLQVLELLYTLPTCVRNHWIVMIPSFEWPSLPSLPLSPLSILSPFWDRGTIIPGLCSFFVLDHLLHGQFLSHSCSQGRCHWQLKLSSELILAVCIRCSLHSLLTALCSSVLGMRVTPPWTVLSSRATSWSLL